METLLMLFLLFVMFYTLIIERRQKEYKEKVRKSGIFEVDQMSGNDFEVFLKELLKEKGYKVRLTSRSGDYGADLLLLSDNKTIVVQTKRYKNKVGLKAVQEIVSAKSFYSADESWVITNNYFTAPALNLGVSNEVILIDRNDLIEWMSQREKVTHSL